MRTISRCAAVVVFGGCLLGIHPAVAGAAASDPWITAKTKMALMTTDDLHSSGINVDTVDGVVTLHGTVPSAAEKGKAEEESKKIDGVKQVRNLLQIVPEKQEKTVKASDNEIKDRVSRALKDDHALDDSSISVQSVNNGVVLLQGTAKTASDHLEAIQTARAIPGVRKVESEIKSPDRFADEEIRREREPATAGTKRGVGTAVQDMWITTDAKMRLLADSDTPGNDINVDTRSGVVTLFGTVPSAASKTAAENDVRKVSGVKKVVNQLQVVPSSKKDMVEARDGDLKDQIKDRLKARADLDGSDITVDVKNGVARLTGKVENEEQRLAAAMTARSTPGVRAVHDELRLNTARQ